MYQFKYTYSNGIEIFDGDTYECWVEKVLWWRFYR